MSYEAMQTSRDPHVEHAITHIWTRDSRAERVWTMAEAVDAVEKGAKFFMRGLDGEIPLSVVPPKGVLPASLCARLDDKHNDNLPFLPQRPQPPRSLTSRVAALARSPTTNDASPRNSTGSLFKAPLVVAALAKGVLWVLEKLFSDESVP